MQTEFLKAKGMRLSKQNKKLRKKWFIDPNSLDFTHFFSV